MKPTLINLIKIATTTLLILISTIFFIGYTQNNKTISLILGIIFFILTIINLTIFKIKINKEIIKRDEQIRIKERETREVNKK